MIATTQTAARPLVTIVIPCYNYAHYLHECIGSVMAQTYPQWELFIVDDASTEGDVAAEVARFPDKRIELIRHSGNRGLAASRNTGIRAGSGALVLPLDADDKLEQTYLEKLIALLDTNPQYNAVFADFFAFGYREETIRFRLRDIPALLLDQWIPGPGSLFTRTLYNDSGGYFDELRAGNEDWDFWLSAAEHGLAVGHLADPLYGYRQHGESMASRQRTTEYATRRLLYQRHRALFDQYGEGPHFLAEGYRRSAVAAIERRQMGLALRFLTGSLRHSPAPFIKSAFRQLRRLLPR